MAAQKAGSARRRQKPLRLAVYALLTLVVLAMLYTVAGYSLFTNPSFLLERDVCSEQFAEMLAKREGVTLYNVPRVYILPESTEKFFYLPYNYVRRSVGHEGVQTSFTWVDSNEIVLREKASLMDFLHELGHAADYQENPEGFEKKTLGERETFAADFAAHLFQKRRSFTPWDCMAAD